MNALREKVLAIAKSYVGARAGSVKHKFIVDTYNKQKPLPRGYKVTYMDAWCATFVSTVAILAGLGDIIPAECGCGPQIELFKRLGRWVEDDGYTPLAGDIIYYDWEDNGVGDNTGSPNHVGIVESVSGNTITVIEGNYSNMVKRRMLKVNSRYIRGYGIPDYDSKQPVQASAIAKDIEVYVDGKKEVVEGYFASQTNYVPIRFIERFGAKVDYNNATKQITITTKER